MTLFLREHIGLIIVQAIQFILIALVFFLAGNTLINTVSYAIFLGFFILLIYLAIAYYTRKRFYQRLKYSIVDMNQSLDKTGNTPVSEAFDILMQDQYRYYQEKIKTLESHQEEHLTFIDQWVHQMKTPLSVIELTAQDLDEPASSDIREETERIKLNLNTVLYMARLRTIEEDFNIKPIVLAELVQNVIGENKRLFIHQKVYPVLHEKRKNIRVATDGKWLDFIVTQFLQNAVKYSKDKASQIDVHIYEKGKEVVLSVKDYGVGIPTTDINRVFSAFFTGENGRKFRESTGMGLFLSYEAASKLHHEIDVQSAEGNGATFSITFSETQNLTRL